MVNKSEQTAVAPSFKRWWRQALYMPWRTQQYFTADQLAQIEQAVAAAELGHPGEVMVIIEGNLPLDQAYRLDTRQRAIDLFSSFKVWDTQYNSGMLLYVNICEHQVEVLADRNIHEFVAPEHWQTICDQVTTEFKQENYAQGVLAGVELIGKTLQAFYLVKVVEAGNERSNRPILI